MNTPWDPYEQVDTRLNGLGWVALPISQQMQQAKSSLDKYEQDMLELYWDSEVAKQKRLEMEASTKELFKSIRDTVTEIEDRYEQCLSTSQQS